MFGYVVPEKEELKVKELYLYQAYYCGICHAIKKHFGQIPRLTLTYDFAFLAMLLMGIEEDTNHFSMKRCIASPIKKKPVIDDQPIMTYLAEMNVLLSYYKLKDNMQDDSRIIYGIPVGYIWIKIHSLLKKYPKKLGIIEKELNRLRELEKAKSNNIDELSDTFGRIMEIIFEYPKTDENNQKILKWLGFNLGKWIYVLDAYDDIEKDLKNKNFNPFINKDSNDVKKIQDKEKDRVKEYLYCCLDQASTAFDLLQFKKNKSVLKNIMFMGLVKKTEERCHS